MQHSGLCDHLKNAMKGCIVSTCCSLPAPPLHIKPHLLGSRSSTKSLCTNIFYRLCFRARSPSVYLRLEKVNILIHKADNISALAYMLKINTTRGDAGLGMNLWAFSRHRLMWLTSHGLRSQSTLSKSFTTWTKKNFLDYLLCFLFICSMLQRDISKNANPMLLC